MDSFVSPAKCSELYVQDENCKGRCVLHFEDDSSTMELFRTILTEREEDGCTEEEEDNEGAQAAMEKVKDSKVC